MNPRSTLGQHPAIQRPWNLVLFPNAGYHDLKLFDLNLPNKTFNDCADLFSPNARLVWGGIGLLRTWR
jgi:hypothetical protein